MRSVIENLTKLANTNKTVTVTFGEKNCQLESGLVSYVLWTEYCIFGTVIDGEIDNEKRMQKLVVMSMTALTMNAVSFFIEFSVTARTILHIKVLTATIIN